jgi:hypothetical protein
MLFPTSRVATPPASKQEPRRRSQHGLALRRCHGPKSHVVENEIGLAWCRQGYVSASKAPSFVRVVTVRGDQM